MFEELTKSYLDTQKCENVNKRLSVMFIAWKEGKINPRIQSFAEATFIVLRADYGGDWGSVGPCGEASSHWCDRRGY